MADPVGRDEIVNALARAEMGLSPAGLYQVPEVEACFRHVGDLQFALEELVRAGDLRCRESPGSLRYVIDASVREPPPGGLAADRRRPSPGGPSRPRRRTPPLAEDRTG